MPQPNPLTDELSDDVKAELAAKFAAMRASLSNFDTERQRWLNRYWHLQTFNLP